MTRQASTGHPVRMESAANFEAEADGSSGAMNCTPTFEREMLKPISRGAIHRDRGRPPFVTVLAK